MIATTRRKDGKIELLSPSVGLWRDAPAVGTLLQPGLQMGAISVLGVHTAVEVPDGVRGVVVQVCDADRAKKPVGYQDVLLVVDPEIAGGVVADVAAESEVAVGGLTFTAPMSGRFYRRASPDKPPFVSEGDVIEAGQTVALLEVMKTFNRLAYGGKGLPSPARIVRVLPADGDDVDSGAALLELEDPSQTS